MFLTLQGKVKLYNSKEMEDERKEKEQALAEKNEFADDELKSKKPAQPK